MYRLLAPLVIVFVILMCTISGQTYAQTTEPSEDKWDNIMYLTNKVGWGEDKWRHTLLFQSRYNNNFAGLEQWFVEYAATYLITEHFEIVPDLRFTRRPDRREIRPGMGIIYKNLFEKAQLVHQLKWQYDFKGNGAVDSHALRYAIFYNQVLSEKIIGSFIAGGLYEWGEAFTGIWGVRAGPSVSYVFNKQHLLNVGYLYGLVNTKEEPTRWTNAGILTLSLSINIRKDFTYLPAKYINF
ncbi:MAG: DUF2490 domain-containing protein [Reichenbachiella sp.]